MQERPRGFAMVRGALIIADGEWARAKGLKPLATLESWGVVGCDPDVMGLGPVEASRAALDAIDKTADDMEMLEINEAFAPQVLGCVKELGWDLDKVNVNGGAIAVGHPLAASSARITAHLVHNVTKGSGGYALGSACIGGGQGIAVVVKGDLMEEELIYDWNLKDAHSNLGRWPIVLFDETLRDGVQSPSVADPDLDQSSRLVRLMAGMGIGAIDLGLPGAGPQSEGACAWIGSNDPRREAPPSFLARRRALGAGYCSDRRHPANPRFSHGGLRLHR